MAVMPCIIPGVTNIESILLLPWICVPNSGVCGKRAKKGSVRFKVVARCSNPEFVSWRDSLKSPPRMIS